MKKIMKNGKINGLLNVYGIIYMVKNKVNGKCYIGQTVKKNGFNDRYGVGNGRTMIESFYKARKQNNDSSDVVLEDIKKYGLDSFEINECIDYAFSKAELDIKEKTYISIYQSMINNSYNNCNSNNNNNFIDKITNGIFVINPYSNYYIGGYNKTSGGAGIKDYKWPEESKQKLKEIKNTPEAIERARKAATKENLSPETLKKRSESLKGHYISDDTKSLISGNIEKMWEDGKYSSEEVKKNMSEGQKRRYEDEDNRMKTSEATKKCWEDDNYREKVLNGIHEYWSDESNRENHSKKMKEKWEDNDYREKVSSGIQKCWDDESNHKTHSDKIKKKWEDNSYREKVLNGIHEYWSDESNHEKLSKISKQHWEDDDYREKVVSGIKKYWDDDDKREQWSKTQKEIQNRSCVKEKKSKTMTEKWQNTEYKSQVSDTLSKKWEDETYRNNVVNGIKKAWKNEDLRKQQSKNNSGRKNPRAKVVICISSVKNNYDRKIFAFMREAAEWTGEKCNCSKKIYNKIARCCEGKIDFCGKMPDGTLLKWRYLKDLSKEELKDLLNKDLIEEEKEMVQNELAKNKN